MTRAADNRCTSQCAGAGDPQMVFNRKGSFFLDLSGESPQPPVSVAPVRERVAAPKTKAAAGNAPAITIAAATGTPTATDAADAPTASAQPAEAVRTTAEELAAELAAAQASRPPVSTVTFAPENLTPGAFIPRRRRGGANLAGFRSMASSLFGS
jgi:hypothetical protein